MLHAVVIVIKKQLSLTAMSNECMGFIHLQLHAQMPDDDTTIDTYSDVIAGVLSYLSKYTARPIGALHFSRNSARSSTLHHGLHIHPFCDRCLM